jgi:glycerol-3-phosphate acyltransferase PlsY
MGIIYCVKYLALKSATLSIDLSKTESIFNIATSIVLAYILGSISFSYIIFKKKTGKDIRTVGSKNAGASNVRRFLGTKYYILILILDIVKGAAAVLLAKYFTEDITCMAIAGAAAILGHSYPVWMGFRGGKSVAVTLGVFIPLNIWAVLIFAAVYFSLVGFLKIVSVASLTGSLCLVIGAFLFSEPLPVILLAAFAFLLIVWRHRSNIKRLIAGEESKTKTVKNPKGEDE